VHFAYSSESSDTLVERTTLERKLSTGNVTRTEPLNPFRFPLLYVPFPAFGTTTGMVMIFQSASSMVFINGYLGTPQVPLVVGPYSSSSIGSRP